MDIRIVNVVLDVFDEYGEAIRFDYDRFEEALNDEAFDLMDERYLVMLGFRTGVFDAMIFDEELDKKGYVQYLMNEDHLSEEEALFLVSVLETILDNVGYYFEIQKIDQLLQNAYQNQDLFQLNIIAKAYFIGFGVIQDYEKAFHIYSYLYSQGDDHGSYYLGYMYERGYGVEKNVEKALMYYLSCHDNLCHYRLGVLYMLGRYVIQDEKKALEYLSLSHYPEAYLYKGLLLEKQREYALAFQSFYQGAQLYQNECLYKVGMALKVGLGVTMNLKDAVKSFEHGYYLMHGDCAYQLAMNYFDGLIYKKDEVIAMKYLREAADLYSYDACFLLGQFYEQGQYVKQDVKKAASYYCKAEEIQICTQNIIIESFEDE